MHRTIASLLLILAFSVPAAAQEPPAAAAPAPAWKPFQELAFALGSYSGTADASPRVGGAVSRWSMEMNGNFLVHRVNTIFPAQEGKPEESIELLGYYVYDREARKYAATYYFSTGLVGIFDVDFPQEGIIRLVSSRVVNFDPGARAQILVTRKADGAHELALALAAPGKDFVPYFTSRLSRK